MFKNEDFSRSSVEKPGWKLTFYDDFDSPLLDDMYWFPAYRSGRKEYFKRIGRPSRWQNHNAYYEIADSILKLKITSDLPPRKNPEDWCVSCICTSDHRFGKDTSEVQILEKFAQEFGRFEIRCRCAKAKGGILNAFWLHHTDPMTQEYTPEGEFRRESGEKLEIDIFETIAGEITPENSYIHFNLHYAEKAHFSPQLPIDLSEHFHEIAVEWDPDTIGWFVNGVEVARYHGETPRGKMFILMALFQYSGWIGEIDPEMSYPKELEIDYVRVYKRI